MARICSLPSILATSQSQVLLDSSPVTFQQNKNRKQEREQKEMTFKSGETEESEVVWLFGCLPSYLTIKQPEVLLDQQQMEML